MQEPVVEPPQGIGTGSNLVDVGRAATHARDVIVGDSDRRQVVTGEEATVKVCGVAVARLQGNSWVPIPSKGRW